MVFTDNRNLKYILQAKWLCPLQVRWALFFSRFDYVLTYCPGSCNGKADMLSRCFLAPEAHIMAPITWDLDREIERMNSQASIPQASTGGKRFVPETLREKVIKWAHSTLATRHPGVLQTVEMIGRKYWWPLMCTDVERAVRSCIVCDVSKTPHNCLAANMVTHSGGFCNGPPVSKGYMVILMAMDCFSKGVRFLPFASSPITAFPEDILSDHGPQFISRVWLAFFKKLGTTVSLTSGYHPESNGQAKQLPPGLLPWATWNPELFTSLCD